MSTLLLQANATIIHCHSRTLHLSKLTCQADLLVVAIGKKEFIDASYVKKGAIVVDVGINRNSEGQVVGDVAYQKVSPLCAAISPVPGGIGPMTIAMLMRNTIEAAEKTI